jgi:hypothetical protein
MRADWKRFRSTMMIELKSRSVNKANARRTAVERNACSARPLRGSETSSALFRPVWLEIRTVVRLAARLCNFQTAASAAAITSSVLVRTRTR